MNDLVQITDEDRANIEKFVGRQLSSITRDEEGVLENLINRGLIGMPCATPTAPTTSSASRCYRKSTKARPTQQSTASQRCFSFSLSHQEHLRNRS
jgi:hypothetical protein